MIYEVVHRPYEPHAASLQRKDLQEEEDRPYHCRRQIPSQEVTVLPLKMDKVVSIRLREETEERESARLQRLHNDPLFAQRSCQQFEIRIADSVTRNDYSQESPSRPGSVRPTRRTDRAPWTTDHGLFGGDAGNRTRVRMGAPAHTYVHSRSIKASPGASRRSTRQAPG